MIEKKKMNKRITTNRHKNGTEGIDKPIINTEFLLIYFEITQPCLPDDFS